jgi:DNA-binding beta-propeller fold protein YncE
VFVACAGSNKVFQIDPSTGAVVGTALTLPTPGSGLTPAPAGVVTLTSTSVAPANTRVVVGDAANDRLFVVGENGASGPQILGAAAGVAVPGCVPANMSPEAPAAGTRGFVLACPGNGTIAAIQVTTASALSNLGTQYVGNGAGPTDTTSRPYGVAYRSADNRLVVTLSGANTAKVYDSQNLPLGPPLSTFTTGPYPDQVTLFASQASGVAGQANVSLAYLANSGDGTVWVVDPPMKKRKHGHKKQTAAKKLAAKKLAAKKLAAKRKLAKKLAAKKRKAGVRVARAGIDARNVAELRARAYTNPLHPPLTVAARG